ncbi:L,D-transpeptidase [Paenibacillus sp. CAU 1782]
MNKPEDVLYLKQFVKQHPNNQMGWYLLGKHYREVGKEGKANYCFIQAGNIYEAFEEETHPIALAEQQLASLKDWEKKQKKKRRAWRVALLALPLLLLALVAPAQHYLGDKSSPEEDDAVAVAPLSDPELGVLFVPKKEIRPVGYALNGIIAAGNAAPDQSFAITLDEQEGWRSWLGNAKFWLSATKGEGQGKFDVAMMDRDACQCEPGDSMKLKSQFGAWQADQELHWTVMSGIQHYKRIYGKWPGGSSDLVRPYPNNVLSGDAKEMEAVFARVLAKLKEQEQGTSDGDSSSGNDNSNSSGSGKSSVIGSNGLFQGDWSKPLEIIIDTSNHTLAVVQNDLVIRSYKVGLGGDRTPEGTFYIGEKVRDPQSEDEGIFGTRGMTLSNTLYAIHGTNKPDSIGKDESLGCIRMYNEDVEELFDMVPLGTTVKIKNGSLPSRAETPEKRFKLQPQQNESNPAKVYKWLT